MSMILTSKTLIFLAILSSKVGLRRLSFFFVAWSFQSMQSRKILRAFKINVGINDNTIQQSTPLSLMETITPPVITAPPNSMPLIFFS